MIIKLRVWTLNKTNKIKTKHAILLKIEREKNKKVYKWSQKWKSNWVIEQLKPISKIKNSINKN